MRIGPALIERVENVQQGADGQGDGQHDEGAADVLRDRYHGFGHARHHGYTGGQHQRRDDVRQALDDAAFLDLAMATQGGRADHAVDGAHQDTFDDPVRQPGGDDQGKGGGEGEQFRLFVQPTHPGIELIRHFRLRSRQEERPTLKAGHFGRRTLTKIRQQPKPQVLQAA